MPHLLASYLCLCTPTRLCAADAEDLTQAFFEHFLERKLLTVADQQKGRFRTVLLNACEYFLAKHWRDSGDRSAAAVRKSFHWMLPLVKNGISANLRMT